MIAGVWTSLKYHYSKWVPVSDESVPDTGVIDSDMLTDIFTGHTNGQFTIDVPRISELWFHTQDSCINLQDTCADRGRTADALVCLLQNHIACDTMRCQVCALMCQTVLNEMWSTVLLKRFRDTPFVCMGGGKQTNRISVLSDEHVCVKIQKVFDIVKIEAGSPVHAHSLTLTCMFDLNTEDAYACLHSYWIDQTTTNAR